MPAVRGAWEGTREAPSFPLPALVSTSPHPQEDRPSGPASLLTHSPAGPPANCGFSLCFLF